MANKKISELTAGGALTGTEQVEVNQGGVSKRTTTQDIADLGGGAGVTSVNGDTGPAVVLDATDVSADPAGSAAAAQAAAIAAAATYTNGRIVAYGIALSDLVTPLTTGVTKAYFRMPHAMTLTAVRASLRTTQYSGSILTVDIKESGVSVLSTKLTIDNMEKTSVTALTPAVISDAALADDAEITFDIDQVGDGTAIGLIVWIIGTKTV